MGTCNYCAFKKIRRRAKKENTMVTIIPTYNPEIQTQDMKGINVYVHPEDMDITDENKDRYFDTWFMDLPDKCACS